MTCEVVAVLGQEVVLRAEELVTRGADNGIDFGGRGKGEAVEKLELE